MLPPDVTAEWIATIMVGAFASMGAVAWYLSWLLERGCKSCLHCKQKRKDEAGDDSKRERLFGKQVEAVVVEEQSDVPSDEGSPDDSDGSSGPTLQERFQAWLFLRLVPEDVVVVTELPVGDNGYERYQSQDEDEGSPSNQADSRNSTDSPTTGH